MAQSPNTQNEASHQPYPWIAHYDEGVPATVEIPDKPLYTLLTDAAKAVGDRPALIFYGKKISYAQLDDLSSRFARSLKKIGITKGDRVAICLPNTPQYPIAFFGALKAGAVVVSTNPLYTVSEMRHQLTDSGAKAIITLDILFPVVKEARNTTSIEKVIITAVKEYLPFPLSALYPIKQAQEQRGKPVVSMKEMKQDSQIVFLQDLLNTGGASVNGNEDEFADPAFSPNELAVLQYTGGTTGVAKGAMLTQRNLMANTLMCAAWIRFPRYSVHSTLAVAPFFHVYGLTVGLLTSMWGGSSCVLLPRFVPKDVVSAIERYRTDVFPGIPTMYIAISRYIEKRGKGDISSVRVCLSGAAPLLHEVQERFERLSGARVAEGYGLTETSPVTHANPLFGDRRIGTIGVPYPSTAAKVIDPVTGDDMPLGEAGELAIFGPQVMKGYWNRPDETAKVFQNGWLKTGDIATMNSDGYFTIVDRAKDIIIAGGYNIYPREVEETLAKHPAVRECVVVGVPDAYRGETVRAYIVLKDGAHATPDEIIAFCQQDLAKYKVPKQVFFRKELPKSLIGKVLRRELREEAIAEAAKQKQNPS